MLAILSLAASDFASLAEACGPGPRSGGHGSHGGAADSDGVMLLAIVVSGLAVCVVFATFGVIAMGFEKIAKRIREPRVDDERLARQLEGMIASLPSDRARRARRRPR